jgi:hypothetical protein
MELMSLAYCQLLLSPKCDYGHSVVIKKVRRWHMERHACSDDELGRLREETQHQKRRLAQLAKEYADTKACLDLKDNDAQRLSTSLQTKEAEWSSKERQQTDEIARLSAALASCACNLESTRSANEILSREKADLQQDLDRERNERRSEVEKESLARIDAVSKLAEAETNLRNRTIDLQNMSEKCKMLEEQRAQSSLEIADLQAKLSEALRAKSIADRRIQEFEEQALAQEALKTSRLGFVTEVWALHGAIATIKSNIQAMGAKKANPSSSSLGSAKAGRLMSDMEGSKLQQSIDNIHTHSKYMIAKYLTDHEKLHLGAPLAHYEGGHDSPRPLDWSSTSAATSPTRATDCSFSSMESDNVEDGQPLEMQKRKPSQQPIKEASTANRQQAFQPVKRSPRRNSPSSARG